MVGNNKKKRNNIRNNKKHKIRNDNTVINKSNDQEFPEDQEAEYDNSMEDDLNNKSNKRQYPESDSDVDDKPQKKKKKKQLQTTDSGDKKGKKSIRQMKREKHAQRQAEAVAVAKDHLKSQCVTYLSQWKHDRQNWKFMKAKQVWLYKNKFNSNLLPDSSWPTFLEYFESAKGNIRNMLLEDSNKVIKLMDEWTESEKDDKADKNEEDNTTEIKKPDETMYKRARDLIQCLEE